VNIRERIEKLREEIEKTCLKVGRASSEVQLVAVSKGVEVARILEAIECGLKDFGENYFQEAYPKIISLSRFPLKWHFIGRLQRNKAKKVASFFHLIHSIDSLRIGEVVNAFGELNSQKTRCLLEINIGLDPNKGGLLPGQFEEIGRLLSLPFLSVEGLMTITPLCSPEEARIYFRRMRELLESINNRFGVKLNHLSMGMSQDFTQAIEEGATIIRVGRAIFGERRKRG
jgi:pyridoxal phosphate enzyme (YggS family)